MHTKLGKLANKLHHEKMGIMSKLLKYMKQAVNCLLHVHLIGGRDGNEMWSLSNHILYNISGVLEPVRCRKGFWKFVVLGYALTCLLHREVFVTCDRDEDKEGQCWCRWWAIRERHYSLRSAANPDASKTHSFCRMKYGVHTRGFIFYSLMNVRTFCSERGHMTF